MKNINLKQVQFDIFLAERFFGKNMVYWGKNLEWIMIKNFPLSSIYNQRFTNCLIVIPNGYGFGVGLEEFYLNKGVKVKHKGKWVDVAHIYDNSTSLNKYSAKNWAWLCIHPDWEKGDNLITFLKQVELFLKYPFEEQLR